jgi:hypothetical protein
VPSFDWNEPVLPGEFWPEPDEDDDGDSTPRRRGGGGGSKRNGRPSEAQVTSPCQALEAIKSLSDA